MKKKKNIQIRISFISTVFAINRLVPRNKIQAVESSETFQLDVFKGSLCLNLKPVYLMLLVYLLIVSCVCMKLGVHRFSRLYVFIK